MSDESRIVQAALDWAVKIERGEAETNPYVTALADRVRDLEQENAKLQLAVDFRGVDWQSTLDNISAALDAERRRSGALADALRPFVTTDLQAEQMTLGASRFTVIPSAIYAALVEAMRRAEGALRG